MEGFKGRVVLRPTWKVQREVIAEAAAITIELLRETGRVAVTYYDIARRRMGLSGEGIPDALAEEFGDSVRILRDKRHQIRDEIEALGEFDLVICCADGRPACGAGGQQAAGFAIRNSAAGKAHEHMQFGMTRGKLVKTIDRAKRAGVIDNRGEACARSLVDSLATTIDREPEDISVPELSR